MSRRYHPRPTWTWPARLLMLGLSAAATLLFLYAMARV